MKSVDEMIVEANQNSGRESPNFQTFHEKENLVDDFVVVVVVD